MAIQSMQLDPNAASYTDDEIVGKVNTASVNITRAGAVESTARPIEDEEISSSKLAAGVAKANLDSMADTDRSYIKTSPTTGEFKVINVQRDVNGKLDIDYDDVAV